MSLQNLPLVDVFAEPYEVWSHRKPTQEESLEIFRKTGKIRSHVKDKLITTLDNPLSAAKYICFQGADNGLGKHINDALSKNANYATWQKAMPSRTPDNIARYQKSYIVSNLYEVDKEINTFGSCLSYGQVLYHGGSWRNFTSHFTTRPLSPTFCPQVALRNSEHRGKAYDSNGIDLLVLKVVSENTRAFRFKRTGTTLGHENEVLLAAGIRLSPVAYNLVNASYTVCKYKHPVKQVQVCVVQVEVS